MMRGVYLLLSIESEHKVLFYRELDTESQIPFIKCDTSPLTKIKSTLIVNPTNFHEDMLHRPFKKNVKDCKRLHDNHNY